MHRHFTKQIHNSKYVHETTVKSLISGVGLLIERMKRTVTLKEIEQKNIKNLTVQVTYFCQKHLQTVVY